MRARWASLLLLLLAAAGTASADDAQAILQQVDRNLAPDSYEMYRKLINLEPDGTRKEFVLYTAKKGRDSMLGLFLDPPADAGRTTLRLGDNMWLYIPDVGKPIRITSLQSVVGGIFNNSDLMRLEFSTEYDAESVDDRGETLLLSLKAKTGAVAYDRLKMTVDKTTILPVTIEAYAASGLLIKTLRYKDIKDFGNGIRRPSVMETDSPLHAGYKAVMLFANIRDRDFDDEVFTLNYMARAKELR
ncbi:MAG: outer membrane lipoprotein-sorting protein [Gammaproteobacteria bacterium]|nr:outer membrane lipoprotein-sorting protein [Gammaproteobacteria bacterium]